MTAREAQKRRPEREDDPQPLVRAVRDEGRGDEKADHGDRRGASEGGHCAVTERVEAARGAYGRREARGDDGQQQGEPDDPGLGELLEVDVVRDQGTSTICRTNLRLPGSRT